ncbi:ammonium transporter [Nitrospiraceae bacterium HYJII51-Mn-bac16s-1-B09]|uniref:Ammonium transporter n=2 Tax=Candidatus Manganitrophus noduliformans TaxID=2606439 RepID=A0A7X6DLF9_9BACT|nr:ammonium transporter [Candidatus Manganitrophus noduliformans]
MTMESTESAPPAPPAVEGPSETKVALDTLWVVIAGMLVFFMNTGFAMVESGFCRSKNTVNILSKNFIVFAISTLAFWFIGWGLMFGDGNGFVGTSGLFFLGGEDNSPMTGDGYSGVYGAIAWATVPLLAKFFFQLVFAGTAATIVSGVVAERIKYLSFIVFSFVLVAFIYPIVGHWIWGGGWIAGLGMWDFAGSTVVHSVGGWAALAGVLVLGARLGKYKDGRVQAIPGHNMALGTLGALILWLGWYGFNPGSTMAAAPGDISRIIITTTLAAAAGLLVSTATAWTMLGKPDLGMSINGMLGGLVGITAPCAFVSPGSAVIIGAICGFLVVLAVMMFDRLQIDDPVGALSVHLVCGIFGTLAVGLFAQDAMLPNTTGNGLLFGGGAKLLISQLIGVAAVGAFTFVVSYIIWVAIKATLGVRVSEQEEMEGLDIGEHGNAAYPDFAVSMISSSGAMNVGYASPKPKVSETEKVMR